MKPLNKSLLPKRNKYTHKQILDLSGSVPLIRKYPVKPYVLSTALFLIILGFVFFWIPMINPLTMGLAAKTLIGRFG